MNTGLLPLLINRLTTTRLGYSDGRFGYFPLLDGLDIGQAFARAALAPGLEQYSSFNIIGPDCPDTHDVIHFLQKQVSSFKTACKIPALASHYYAWCQEHIKAHEHQSAFTRSLANMMANPLIDNELARNKLGYDPEISWQASLHKLVDDLKKRNHTAALYATTRPFDPV